MHTVIHENLLIIIYEARGLLIPLGLVIDNSAWLILPLDFILK